MIGADSMMGNGAVGATGSTGITGFKLAVRPLELEALAVRVLVRRDGFERPKVPLDSDALGPGEDKAGAVDDAMTPVLPEFSLKVIDAVRRGLLDE